MIIQFTFARINELIILKIIVFYKYFHILVCNLFPIIIIFAHYFPADTNNGFKDSLCFITLWMLSLLTICTSTFHDKEAAVTTYIFFISYDIDSDMMK